MENFVEVRIEEDTVWLNRQQMAELFARDVKTITYQQCLERGIGQPGNCRKFCDSSKRRKPYYHSQY